MRGALTGAMCTVATLFGCPGASSTETTPVVEPRCIEHYSGTYANRESSDSDNVDPSSAFAAQSPAPQGCANSSGESDDSQGTSRACEELTVSDSDGGERIYECRTTTVDVHRTPASMPIMGALQARILPGLIVGQGAVDGISFDPVVAVPRADQITLSTDASVETTFRRGPADTASLRQMVAELTREADDATGTVDVLPATNVAIRYLYSNTLEDSLQELGLSASLSSRWASGGASAQRTRQTSSRTTVVRMALYQTGFTVSVDTSVFSSPWEVFGFEDKEGMSRSRACNTSLAEPLWLVDSVTYGRLILVEFSSDAIRSKKALQIAVSASFRSPSVSGEGSANLTLEERFRRNRIEMNILFRGGDQRAIREQIRAAEGADTVAEVFAPIRSVEMVPVAYTLANISQGLRPQPFSFTSRFTQRECTRTNCPQSHEVNAVIWTSPSRHFRGGAFGRSSDHLSGIEDCRSAASRAPVRQDAVFLGRVRVDVKSGRNCDRQGWVDADNEMHCKFTYHVGLPANVTTDCMHTIVGRFRVPGAPDGENDPECRQQ